MCERNKYAKCRYAIFLTWLLLFCSQAVASGVLYADTAKTSRPMPSYRTFGDVHHLSSCYSIALSAGYAFNTTYTHHGIFTLDTHLPVYNNFEIDLNLRSTTANTYDFGLSLTPLFPLATGQIFIDINLIYNLNIRNGVHGIAGSLSVGYQMDYLRVKIGYGARLFAMMEMSKHTVENGILEPHNLIYHAEVFVRPASTPWNLSALITNLTEYQMERMFSPSFFIRCYVEPAALFINVRRHPSLHWKLQFTVGCKPAGLSNLTPSFYGAEFRAGAMYKF